MSVVVITGSAGLIGSEASRHFAGAGLDVVGVDNDMRRRLVLLPGLWRARHQEILNIVYVFFTWAIVAPVDNALFVSTWLAPALYSFLTMAPVARLGFVAPPETPRGTPT